MVDGLLDILHRYWYLGLISFGGPGVHVVILRERFVDKYKWVDPKTFLDLFALGNALPGPGSTQLAFSIAVVRHGVLAGLLAFGLWSLPGAIGMAGLAVGVSRIPNTLPPLVLALLTGLNAAAVGLIALAAVQLANAAISDRVTLVLLWLSASLGVCYHAPWMYPTLIAAGGLATLVYDFRRQWIRRLKKLGRSGRADDASDRVEMTSTGGQDPAAAEEVHTEEDTPRPTSSPLNVVSPRIAISLLVGFMLLLTVPLATRSGLKNAGRSVPRPLDVSCIWARGVYVLMDSFFAI